MSTPPNIDAELQSLDPSGLAQIGTPAPGTAKAARRLTRRIERRRFVRLAQHGAAVDHLQPLPMPGEIIHGAMDGRFSGWSLATAAIELLAEPVAELTISTLGFNRDNCDSLIALLDAATVKAVLLNVSNYFRHSDRQIFGDIRRALESRGQSVAVTRSHAKLILLRTTNRNIVIETSANLRSSQNWEQFTLSDDPELLQFHRDWIHELVEATK